MYQENVKLIDTNHNTLSKENGNYFMEAKIDVGGSVQNVTIEIEMLPSSVNIVGEYAFLNNNLSNTNRNMLYADVREGIKEKNLQ